MPMAPLAPDEIHEINELIHARDLGIDDEAPGVGARSKRADEDSKVPKESKWRCQLSPWIGSSRCCRR